jgi:hypothetical protein
MNLEHHCEFWLKYFSGNNLLSFCMQPITLGFWLISHSDGINVIFLSFLKIVYNPIAHLVLAFWLME